jgi:CobQ-like glutamine amidotransferase family enzyme
MMMSFSLRLAHLYPQHMNLYGDRGNVLCLLRRMQWRGWALEVVGVGLGPHEGLEDFDLYLWGGGQDAQQWAIVEDLHQHKAQGLRQAMARQAAMLAICGGYQLLGHYYQPQQGERLQGLGLLNLHTVAGAKRLIGNVQAHTLPTAPPALQGLTLVGFENHSGKTYLGEGLSPLAKLQGAQLQGPQGGGNNGEDGFEGVLAGNVVGTYLHGPVLPKNPALADFLLYQALVRKYGEANVPPLHAPTLPLAEDILAQQAHHKALSLAY